MLKNADDQTPVLLWFRRDLRLQDNYALRAAVDTKRPIIAFYIREPAASHAGGLGSAQGWWLHHSLAALDASLEKYGNRLLLFTGPPQAVIDWLISQTGSDAVYWNRRYDPDGIRTDTEIKAGLKERGLAVESFAGMLMHEPHKLLTGAGKRYSVYTPFWRAFEGQYEPHDLLPAPRSFQPSGQTLDSDPLDSWGLLPTKPDWSECFSGKWHPGEHGALAALDDFLLRTIAGYDENRDIPAVHGTSRLSPHLALGEISPHRIWQATQANFDSLPTEDLVRFRKELVWREFSWHLLFHTPDLPSRNLNRRFDDFPWLDDKRGLRAWQRGLTGYPLVDAGMRELWQTGWMHNRVRMVVASFLIKDLLIDWREGEKWFRDTLLDADIANNAASWQWVAGCGADAAPYFRIFNPSRQGETFDPDGAYVKQYCPELSGLPARFIHRPFEAPEAIMKAAGVVLGKTYPKPIIEHDRARKRALAAYKEISGHVEP
jgi:deoxyribodipyrimidine photo-lyase